MTFWLAHYNLKTGDLQYISAGHSKPLVYRAATGITEFLDAGGMPLGMDDDFLHNSRTAQDHAGEKRCFLCSTPTAFPKR